MGECPAWRVVARIGAREYRATISGASLVVGSAPDCDLVLPDPTVSRRHALLTATPNGVCAEDLGSRNGTRVEGGGAAAESSTAIHLGDVELRVEAVLPGDAVSSDGTPIGPPQAAGAARVEPTFVSAGLSRFCVRELEPLLAVAADGNAALFSARVIESLARSIRESSFRLRLAANGATVARAGTSDARLERVASDRYFIEFACSDDDRPTARMLAALSLSLHALAAAVGSPKEAGAEPRRIDAIEPPRTSSVLLRDIYWQAARVAPSRLNVLLVGESGTGKEVLARYLHQLSGEPAERYVTMNCAALPTDLLEAELFGIEAGVATGVAARPGRFELANGGTLFLDEIGDMSLDTQARILRVLQERVVHRVGGHKPRPADVRIVSATHRDLDAMVADGRFRLDLYHRIADWRAALPPLRERRDDIPNLAGEFLTHALSARGFPASGFTLGALTALEHYAWPGNVRELEREMQRIALFLEPGEAVPSTMLKAEIRAAQASSGSADGLTLAARLEREERRIVATTLAESRGQVGEAAARLGVSKATLYRRISQLGLNEND